MSGPGAAKRRVRALSARTYFVAGYGQVHFDPDSDNAKVRFPEVPEEAIEFLVNSGWVADDVDDAALASAPAAAQPAPAAPRAVKSSEPTEIQKLRADYKALIGKNPFGSWPASELVRRMNEFRVSQASSEPTPATTETDDKVEGEGEGEGDGAEGADSSASDAPPVD